MRRGEQPKGYAGRMTRFGARSLWVLFALVTAGCASIVGAATGRLSRDLSLALRNQDDVETVRQGAPAYLLLIDGLIEGDPEDAELLLAGAGLYSVYASAFVEDPERAKHLARRAYHYGLRALCTKRQTLCERVEGPFDRFDAALHETRVRDVPLLYGFGSAWATSIQLQSGDWDAIAQLPKLQALMMRVADLEEGYERGGAHLYLGVLATLRPESLGGQPELGRRHFERADELALDRNLLVKVLFAQHYARLVFDRSLHDRLLHDVLAAEPREPGLTLSNVIARQRAEDLLSSAEDYF